ncbi:MAG TPA: transaldolase [Candidatus Omnitrophica bacterium]|nr:MAG: transaldolase [Omnitrophica WOR_2 bacterium GWA2_45_18]HBR14282.1 transaldolase [Candidatus Omnitrophota bacterium]
MSHTTIQELAEFGQSAWLDYINRAMLENGKLKDLVAKGLRGLTSNPSIFNQVISSSPDYDARILQLKKGGRSTFEIYDELTVADIRDAADIFTPVYEKTDGLDGYVSLEINPKLANQVEPQVNEGIRLFKKVNRPNLMIKVPATKAGLQVVEELTARGINVNATLIFSLEQYVETAQSYLRGLKRLAGENSNLNHVRSVASVFISRMDTAVDEQLEEILADMTDSAKKSNVQSLKGRAAVANSRIIFEKFKELFAGNAFKSLEAKKANVQRVLWGSTSTKNPAYSDIKYVTELIAQPTVNTIPEKTLNAFLDHGHVKDAFTYDVREAHAVIQDLKDLGIDVRHVCEDLLRDGVVAFEDAFDALLASIEKKAAQLSTVKS